MNVAGHDQAQVGHGLAVPDHGDQDLLALNPRVDLTDGQHHGVAVLATRQHGVLQGGVAAGGVVHRLCRL